MSLYSTLFIHPPRWRGKRPGNRPAPSGAIQSWLFESGSLTQRLRLHYGDRLCINLRLQCWRRPNTHESRLLGLPDTRYSLIREVLLHAEGTPLILARSIIPAATIKAAQRNLSHLGTRPLGEVIFAYPNLQRLNPEITQVSTALWRVDCRAEFNIQQSIWGRRTIYAIPGHPLLVSEFFLPAVFDLP